MNLRKWLVTLAVVFLTPGLTGCSPKIKNDLSRIWDSLVDRVAGPTPGEKAGDDAPTGAGKKEKPLYSETARSARANAETLKEMYTVVHMREPTNRAEFGNWADTLNQGASYEGVYNGLTHSSDFRKLEASNPGASPKALGIFGRELALIEKELEEPALFTKDDASPLPFPVQPGIEPEKSESTGGMRGSIDFGEEPPAEDPRAGGDADEETAGEVSREERIQAEAQRLNQVSLERLAEEYSNLFVGASIFTLKRVLGDELLRLMNARMEYPEQLALWYAKWVVHMSSYGVDFGLELRNKADQDFHYAWALKASADRVKWEALNRVLRVLNEAN